MGTRRSPIARESGLAIKKKGRYSSEDIHRALFGDTAPHRRSLDELKDGIRRYIRKRCGQR